MALAGFWLSAPVSADEVRVAVAANFLRPLQQLSELFESERGISVVPISGSTGKLYAQIHNGAPFDLFLAADAARPARLEAEGLARSGSRATYALGRLVLWSPSPGYVTGPETLERDDFRHLSIANLHTAPYGAAAVQTLRQLGVWDRLQGRLVQGESVGQAYRFVAGGSAELGLVAASQLLDEAGSSWPVPASLHDPIEQQLVLLERAAASPAAPAFRDFLLRDPAADALIRAAGYDRPASSDADRR